MRVLTVGNLYPPNHLGGYELMWEAAVEALRARGHEVRVLANPELRSYWVDHKFPLRRKLLGPVIEQENRRVFAEAAAEADIVSFWSMGGMTMSIVEHRPSIAVVMDDWLLYGPLVDPVSKVRRRTPKVDRALYISAFTAERAGQPGEVLHAGYDERVFTEQPAREDWGGRLYLPGRLDPRKGQQVAIAALPEGMTLLISGVGDEKYGTQLRKQAGPGVTFSTTRDRAEIAREYADADAVLFPVDWSEPFGLVPLEAMAVGRPVIATGAGGSAEYLRDEENCLLVPRGDAEALRAAIERLAGDPDLRARLRAAGLETARGLTLTRFLDGVCDAHEAYAAGR